MAETDTTPKDEPAPGSDSLAEFRALFEEQRERQTLFRHVQQFLKSPTFFDLREARIMVADSPDAIEERKRELDYRITVVQSLLTLMTEEREALDRAVSTSDTAKDSGKPKGKKKAAQKKKTKK